MRKSKQQGCPARLLTVRPSIFKIVPSLASIFAALIYTPVQAIAAGISANPQSSSAGTIVQDPANKTVTIAAGDHSLLLRLNYNKQCAIDEVQVNGSNVISSAIGAYTGINVDGHWATSVDDVNGPTISISNRKLVVSGIALSAGSVSANETWTFTPEKDSVDWRITRNYTTGGEVADTAFPAWNFASTKTWTGAMLDTGGVAWCRLIPAGYSYGEHANTATFWNPDTDDALRFSSSSPTGGQLAARFSNPGSGGFSFVQSATPAVLATKYELRRFNNTQDLWSPFNVNAGAETVDTRLRAFHYNSQFGRGTFHGVDGSSVTELLNTIARYGVIDRHIMGGNGWVSGFCCMHEPFFGEMGIGVDDPSYTKNLEATIDDWRAHALKTDGRVMARWCYSANGDNIVPGTYDPVNGYYDCGWGYLLDAQPDYVINTSEVFDLSGDMTWLKGQKEPCERALDWMLKRDFDNSGLMTMMTDSHSAQKSSDWIDIVYACGKNALVNAEMYYALNLWADREHLLGDSTHALRYREAAAKLKAAFVRPLSEGGFWNPDKGCFDYWVETDGSAHGDNMVTPVNFCAIGYGICSDSQRKIILDNIDASMVREGLFHWPLCIATYQPDECRGMMPFPSYENGDIFLSWGELGVRSYAEYKPEIAVSYIKKILQQYQRDGLSFQRYLRGNQQGAGDDILAGNSMTIVGLYRDIYGIRPQWNRLLLQPHLVPELYGTSIKYKLRGQSYDIKLNKDRLSVAVDGCSVESADSFAVSSTGSTLSCYAGDSDQPSLTFTRTSNMPIDVSVLSWPNKTFSSFNWSERADATSINHTVSGLRPHAAYRLSVGSVLVKKIIADDRGNASFTGPISKGKFTAFSLTAS